MPPKKKGGKGKGKKDAVFVIDGVQTTEMTREQLEEFAHRIHEETLREREERNFFQLERDKLKTFWEITQKQIEEIRGEIRNKDRQMQAAKENHLEELKSYKQKIKHLLYEHQNNIAELKSEGMVSLKIAQDDYTEQEMGIMDDKKVVKALYWERDLAHQDEVRNLRLQHSSDLSKARSVFESEAREIELKYEKKMATQRNELHRKQNMELNEVEERKNRQIGYLIKNHAKLFSEMKSYYNDITLNNLALISGLKDQMEEIKRKEERMDKNLRNVLAENRRLVGPLKQAQETTDDLTKQMESFDEDQADLQNTKTQFRVCQKELDDLKWEKEVLELRFEKLQNETDELNKSFEAAAMEVQQTSSLRTALLENNIAAMSHQLDAKDAQISEVLSAANLDPSAIASVNKKLDDLLKRKNGVIQDLQYELARVCKLYNDALRSFEGKLKRYGIPSDELGFKPMQLAVKGRKLGRAPAGLITPNR